MRIAGVICEYNPFHAGHAYHLAQTRRETDADGVVCVMSGEFTQRGSAAICDKWTRAKMAIAGGADLVVELPVIYATQSAQQFAAGGVRLLHAMGADFLSFGAEKADLDVLRRASSALLEEPDVFRRTLRAALEAGQPYAAAQREALFAVDPALGDAVNTPNNLLATQYLRSLRELRSPMVPVAIERVGAPHAAQSIELGKYPSSGAIRHALSENPEACGQICSDARVPLPFSPVLADEKLFLLAAATLRTADPADLHGLSGLENGLAWRIAKAARKAACWPDLLDSISTRRYPTARVRRLLLHMLLHAGQEDLDAANAPDAPIYARVLAVRKGSMTVLSEIGRRSRCAVDARSTRFRDFAISAFDERACSLYGLLMDPVRPATAYWSTPLAIC